MPTKSPQVGEVVTGLAALLRRGLPAQQAACAPALLELRGVTARTIDPTDAVSRVAALDGVLRGVLARFPDPRYTSAVRALFGLAPGEPGGTLTARREAAARAAGHEVHHFRKRVEPRLLDELATSLLVDADRFTRTGSVAPRLAPAVARESVAVDPFAWEVAEQEELLTRVWAAIYALRAELLAIERLLSLDLDRSEIITHAVTAGWRWALASDAAHAYTAAFAAPPGVEGDDRSSADSASDLIALAGWVPELTPYQQQRLRTAAWGTRAQFVAAMHPDVDVGTAWVGGFLDRNAITDSRSPDSTGEPPPTQEAS